jgi:predicted HNH restriction endonuclease
MSENAPIEIHDRVCPVCGLTLQLAWGRIARKYYWYHPVTLLRDEQCTMRHKGIRFEERHAALIATEIFQHD